MKEVILSFAKAMPHGSVATYEGNQIASLGLNCQGTFIFYFFIFKAQNLIVPCLPHSNLASLGLPTSSCTTYYCHRDLKQFEYILIYIYLSISYLDHYDLYQNLL